MGFGLEKEQDEGGVIQQTLRDVTVPYVPNDVCKQMYGGPFILPEMLCAGKCLRYVTLRYVTSLYYTLLYIVHVFNIVRCYFSVFNSFSFMCLLCVCVRVFVCVCLHLLYILYIIGFTDGQFDACQGDSGGPIVKKILDNSTGLITHIHVGIVR
jgi:hypothetical protein